MSWACTRSAEAVPTGGSGLPVPSRRTFAAALQAFAHSEETFASQSLLRSVSYAGSRGTGNPDLNTVVEVPEATPSAAYPACEVALARRSTLRHAARRSLAQRAIGVALPRRQSAQTGSPLRAGRTSSAARMAAGRAEARLARRGHGWPRSRFKRTQPPAPTRCRSCRRIGPSPPPPSGWSRR